MRFKSVLLAAAGCMSVLAPAAMTFAQTAGQQQNQAPQQSSQENQGQLDEIIVTAEKRQQSFLDVPITENVVSAAQLQAFQVQNLTDMATQVPGLKLSTATNSVGTQVTLRGVGTNTLDAGIDQSVALYVDGLQITQGLAYASAMFDTSQVEVLKGPQALFYGKNSPGGVISIRSNDPTDQYEANVSYGREFEADENDVQMILSGPIWGNVLEGRLAGQFTDSDGWLNLVGHGDPALGGMTPPDSTGPRDTDWLLRGTLLFKPFSEFDARLKTTVAHDHSWESGEETNISCPGGTGTGIAGVPFLPGGPCQRSYDLYQPDLNPAAYPGLWFDGIPSQDTDQVYGTLELNYRPSSAITITSDTGYFDLAFKGTLASPFGNGPAGSGIGLDNGYGYREWSEELRINSDFAGPVNFTAGMYYQDARVRDSTDLIFNNFIPSIGVSDEWYLNDMTIKTWSGFGQVRWNMTSELELDLGGRYTSEKRSDVGYQTLSFVPGSPGIPPGPGVPPGFGPGFGSLAEGPVYLPNIDAHNFSPEGTLSYKPKQELNFYLTAKKGFKSGSYDITASPLNSNGTVASPYGDENVWGVETGMKSLLLDHTLALDVATYWYRYTGLQVGATENTAGGVPVVSTFNAASATINGVDLDANWKSPIHGLQWRGALELNRAHFTSFNSAPCWGGQTLSEGCNSIYSAAANGGAGGYTAQDLGGQPLQRAPLWQISAGPSYTLPLGDMSVTLASNTEFSSRYLMLLGERSDFWQSSYVKTDLSVALNGPDNRWQVAFVGRNLSNTITTGACSSYNNINGLYGGQFQGNNALGHGPSGVDSLSCFIDRGRELWLRLSYKAF